MLLLSSAPAWADVETLTSNPNKAIPVNGYTPGDGTTGMACDTVTIVQDGSDTVKGAVEVKLGILHFWVGGLGLTAKLTSPSGTVLTLFARPGVPGSVDGDRNLLVDNFPITFIASSFNDAELMGSTLGDVGIICFSDSICDYLPNPDTANSGEPGSDLYQFDGEPAIGNWQLCIGDSRIEFEGIFKYWTLKVDNTAIVSLGERSSVLSSPFECKDAYRSTTRWRLVTTLGLGNESPDRSMYAQLVFLNDNEDIIATGLTYLSEQDLDEVNVCATLEQAGIVVPQAGVVEVLVSDFENALDDYGVYSYIKNVLGVFHRSLSEPFEGRTVRDIAKSDCRVAPPPVTTRAGVLSLVNSADPP